MTHEDQHDELGPWAGAYALGALEPDDRRRFEQHLSRCDRCAQEIRLLAPIPGLLARVDADDLDVSIRADTADAIARRVPSDVHALRSSRSRWRAATLAAAAAVILLVGVTLVDEVAGPEPPSAAAAIVTESLAGSTRLTTTERAWGTQIDLDLDGLPPRTQYQLWVVDAAGERTAVANWGPTATGRAVLTSATSTPPDRLDRLVVTSDDPDDVIVDAVIEEHRREQ